MSLWLSIALIVLAALPFLIYPWLRNERETRALSQRRQANLDLFREQCDQYQQQLESGEITAQQQSDLVAEAEQLLLANTQTSETAQAAKPGLWLLLLMMLALPLFAVALYTQLGAASDQELVDLLEQRNQLAQIGEWRPSDEANFISAVQNLAAKRPDNLYYWTLLAQSALESSDLEQAAGYLEKAIAIAPRDGYLLAQYAQVLFFLEENRFTPTVVSAVDRAFAADPNNATSLGLKGIEAYQNAEYQKAIGYWRKALRGLPPSSESALALQSGINQAQTLLGQAPAASGAATSNGPSVVVHLSLDPVVKFQPQQLVFVAVVAANGPPMPIVARRLTAADLPLTLTLTDDDALMAGRDLSSAGRISVVARLSTTGSASPQPGDWEIRSEPLELSEGSAEVALVINQQRN